MPAGLSVGCRTRRLLSCECCKASSQSKPAGRPLQRHQAEPLLWANEGELWVRPRLLNPNLRSQRPLWHKGKRSLESLPNRAGEDQSKREREDQALELPAGHQERRPKRLLMLNSLHFAFTMSGHVCGFARGSQTWCSMQVAFVAAIKYRGRYGHIVSAGFGPAFRIKCIRYHIRRTQGHGCGRDRHKVRSDRRSAEQSKRHRNESSRTCHVMMISSSRKKLDILRRGGPLVLSFVACDGNLPD